MWSRTLAARPLVLALVLALADPTRPAPASASTPRPLPLFAAGAVKRSLAIALERLERAECREVYGDFRDATGATLALRLAEAGQAPAEHLRSLRFLNGAEHPWCRNGRAFLVTTVGSPIVLVCPQPFSEIALRRPVQAAGLLLHEQLHTLGLGENPPASAEISRRVFKRCGG